MKNPTPVRQMIMSALFLALGYLLPMFIGRVQLFGQSLLPMHIPVLLCGFVCSWKWGAAVGAVLPITSSLFFSMPPMYPVAVAMCFELAAYGLLAGLMFKLLPKRPLNIYISLGVSLVGGRLVWGVARSIMAGLGTSQFGLAAFWSGAFATAAPGIAVQLIAIPVIVMALQRAGVMEAPAKKA